MEYRVYYKDLEEQVYGIDKLQIVSEHTGLSIRETWQGPGFAEIKIGNYIENSGEHAKLLRAFELACIDFRPIDREKIFPKMDPSKAKLLQFDVVDIIMSSFSYSEYQYRTRYDYAAVCDECHGGVRRVGVNYVDNWGFSESHKMLAMGKDMEPCAKLKFKEMVEKAGLTGFEFFSTADCMGRPDKIKAFLISSNSIMPPALDNEDTTLCPRCGRHSTSHEPVRYSGESLDFDQLQDFNLGFEHGIGRRAPELIGPCMIVKPSVYQLCRENGIGEDVVKFEYVYVE